MFQSGFVPNTLSIFLIFLSAIQSVWFAFLATEKPGDLSFFAYFSFTLCLFAILLTLWRWKKIKLLPRLLAVFLCIIALLGPIACLDHLLRS